jgi:hypothetical protein
MKAPDKFEDPAIAACSANGFARSLGKPTASGQVVGEFLCSIG